MVRASDCRMPTTQQSWVQSQHPQDTVEPEETADEAVLNKVQNPPPSFTAAAHTRAYGMALYANQSLQQLVRFNSIAPACRQIQGTHLTM
jgi:hypothetical protein